MGFDSFAYLPGLKNLDEFVIRLGINEHYKSISRGVLDINEAQGCSCYPVNGRIKVKP
jgi:hypothetical protein